MKISQEIIDEHSFEVMHKKTGDLKKAIYATAVPYASSTLSDKCFIWIQASSSNSTSGWFWWEEDDFYKTFSLPLSAPQPKDKTYITRYVVDIAWEGVDGIYGDGGSTDCGTVMALENLLENAVEDGSLNFDNVKAVKADWISYVTNAKHKTPGEPIQSGAALHPKLRESKGYWKNS